MKLLKCHIIITVLTLTCLPTVICAKYLWRSDSTAIDLDAQDGHITTQADIREGFATIILDVNGTVMEAQISADISSASQLTHHRGLDDEDILVTKYRIETDGDGGTGGTGATAQAVINSSSNVYRTHNDFLTPTALKITYVPGDNEVAVTLWVEASNIAGNAADSGEYYATQTLTVAWAGN